MDPINGCPWPGVISWDQPIRSHGNRLLGGKTVMSWCLFPWLPPQVVSAGDVPQQKVTVPLNMALQTVISPSVF